MKDTIFGILLFFERLDDVRSFPMKAPGATLPLFAQPKMAFTEYNTLSQWQGTGMCVAMSCTHVKTNKRSP